jgi:uncharacterized protein (TIGR03437 family)
VDVPAFLNISGTPVVLHVNPTSLSFALAAGQGPPASPQTINVTPLSPISVAETTQSGGNWLIASIPFPLSVVEVNATAATLGPGTYTGAVGITTSGNLSATVPVALTVYPSGAGQFSVSPSSLTLATTLGGTTTATLTVAVSSGSPLFTIPSTAGPIQFNYIGSPLTAGNQYTAPATIQLSTNATLPGTYYASITVSWSGGSATIPVTIYVASPANVPPIASAIVSSGSAITGAIAPGELISIFGSGLGAGPTNLELTSNGTVATTLNGTQVLINGAAAPIIYSSSSQVNAIVPYEVSISSTATVQVTANNVPTAAWAIPVAAAAPSVFTTSASGIGQAAIVNADGSVNSASNPASRGSVIQVYATGGGQTFPLSSTGAVAQSSANLSLPVSVTIGGAPRACPLCRQRPG